MNKGKIKFIIFIIILVIIGNLVNNNMLRNEKKYNYKDDKLEFNEASNNGQIIKKDLNKISYFELMEIGFTENQSKRIIEYKDFIGDIKDLEELKKISRFTKKAYEKAEERLYVGEFSKRNKNNINEMTDIHLKWIGFSKKEIEKILKQIENKNINSNLDLIDIIGKDRYNDVKEYIKYKK